MSAAPHEHRPMATSFGVDAARYDRTRPSYPAELLARIVASLPGTAVVDVGCGTGIVARQLALAGCQVLGVEPDARMAAFARDTGVEVEEARFEEWDAAGRSFDGVVAGTAWHWVDPVAGAAKAAQVLRPGGVLAPFWAIGQPPAPVGEALAQAFLAVVPDSPFDLRGAAAGPSAHQPILDRWADGMRAAGFAEPEQWRYDGELSLTRDEWLDYLPTTGGLTRLDAAQLAAILERTGAAVDALGGSLTVSYTCLAVVAKLG